MLWSEAKSSGSAPAIFFQRLCTEGLRTRGKARQLSDGKSYATRPQLQTTGENELAALWVETAAGDIPSALRLVHLDVEGSAKTAVRRIRPKDGATVIDGTVLCDASACRGLLASSRDGQARLEAFTLKAAEGAPVASSPVARLSGLPEGSDHLLMPKAAEPYLLFSQRLGKRSRLRKLLVQWTAR